MKYDELREQPDGYAVGFDRLDNRPLVVRIEGGAIYAVQPGRDSLLGDPERFEPYTRLVPEGSGDFVVDLDTAVANEQAETIPGTVIDGYLMIVAYVAADDDTGLPNYRLTFPGMQYDRALGMAVLARRLLEDGTFTVSDPS